MRIGFIVDQTGPLAAIGAGYLRGSQVAVDAWNSDSKHRRVDLHPCDSQSTGEGAISCYQQLRDSVDAISGPSLFVGLASVRTTAMKGSLPLISAAPLAFPDGKSMMFQNLPTIEDGVGAAFQYFKSTGLKKIATLTSNDQPGNLAKQAAQKLHGQYGIDLVTTQVFDPQAQNLAPQAEQISASHPDAVFAWTAGPQLITSLRALFTAGVSVPVMLNYASMVTPLLQGTTGSSPKTLLFFATKAFDPSHITDQTYAARVKDFYTRFQATFHQPPDLAALDAADDLLILAQAGQNASSRQEIKSKLESGTSFYGIMFADYKFSADDHIGKHGAGAFDILQWQPTTSTWTLVDTNAHS
jgi:ABC-type branched-subunit amino acid transport system substrate-binding protein